MISAKLKNIVIILAGLIPAALFNMVILTTIYTRQQQHNIRLLNAEDILSARGNYGMKNMEKLDKYTEKLDNLEAKFNNMEDSLRRIDTNIQILLKNDLEGLNGKKHAQ